MASSVADLAAKLHRAGTLIPRAMSEGVFESALNGKDITLDAYTSSGLRRTGSRIGRWSVGFDMQGFTNPAALLKVKGRMMHLYDFPTKAHSLAPRRKRGGRYRVLRFTAGGETLYRPGGKHPGTSGKNVFHGKAVPKIAKEHPEVMRRGFWAALRKAGLGT